MAGELVGHALDGGRVPLPPAPPEFLDEFHGPAALEDAGMPAEMLEEEHQARVAVHLGVGQDFENVPIVGKTIPFRHPQEDTGQPIRKIFAQDQQVIVLQLIEQILRTAALRLERADKLQHVLVRDGIVHGMGGEFPQQVIHGRPVQALFAGIRSFMLFGV